MNIPISVYIYLLVILCVFVAFFGYIIYSKSEDRIIRIGIIWYIILMEINLINMIFVLRNFKNFDKKLGRTGVQGVPGPMGYQGDNIMCNSSCGSDGSKRVPIVAKDYYLDDSGKKIFPPLKIQSQVKTGQCIFPFIYDHTQWNNPITYRDNYKISSDKIKGMGEEGWCPTSLSTYIKNGSNVKTFGYCESIKDSLIQERSIEIDNQEKLDEVMYLQNNNGILDLKVVMGNKSLENDKSGLTCPPGYNYVTNDKGTPTDLNYMSGGKYIYMCQKSGVSEEGIVDLVQVDEPSKCELVGNNYYPVQNYDSKTDTFGSSANLNDDIIIGKVDGKNKLADPLYLCAGMGSQNFMTDLIENNTPKKGDGYMNICSVDMNPHVITDKEIYLCGTKNKMSADIVNTVFFYPPEKLLCFFYGDHYMTFDYKKNTIKKIPNTSNIETILIDRKWGVMKQKMDPSPINLNAAFTYGYNNKTYFFKDNYVYLYDDKKEQIALGYPKYINEVFKGIPDNIDSVFTWNKDGKTYFFKGKYFYKYNDTIDNVDQGYPKLISDRWEGPNIAYVNAIYSDLKTNKTMLIEGTNVYEMTLTEIKKIGSINNIYNGLLQGLNSLIKK